MLAGVNTARIANCAASAEVTHERGRGRGANTPSNTATAPKESQKPAANGAIGSIASTKARA